MGAAAPFLDRPSCSVALMTLEKNKQHKWRRNSQGLILLTRSPDTSHDLTCLGPTCTRCGKWYSMDHETERVELCPPRIQFI